MHEYYSYSYLLILKKRILFVIVFGQNSDSECYSYSYSVQKTVFAHLWTTNKVSSILESYHNARVSSIAHIVPRNQPRNSSSIMCCFSLPSSPPPPPPKVLNLENKNCSFLVVALKELIDSLKTNMRKRILRRIMKMVPICS